MTKVYLTNSANTVATDGPYYIEINAAKIEYDYQSNIKTVLEYPKGTDNQDTVSETYFIDLQQRAKTLTITGRIDRYSNRTSAWVASAVNDVGVVAKRIEYMWNRGGVNKLILGYGDGYYNVANIAVLATGEQITGVIEKCKISEADGADHISRPYTSEDYPSPLPLPATSANQVKVVTSYDIIITFREGDLQ